VVALQSRARARQPLPAKDAGRSIALAEEHALLPPAGARRLGSHLRGSVRLAGFVVGLGPQQSFACWARTVPDGLAESHAAGAGGGVGHPARPPFAVAVLAIPAARPAGIWRLGRQFLWQHIFLARRNLPVWQRRQDYSRAAPYQLAY